MFLRCICKHFCFFLFLYSLFMFITVDLLLMSLLPENVCMFILLYSYTCKQSFTKFNFLRNETSTKLYELYWISTQSASFLFLHPPTYNYPLLKRFTACQTFSRFYIYAIFWLFIWCKQESHVYTIVKGESLYTKFT